MTTATLTKIEAKSIISTIVETKLTRSELVTLIAERLKDALLEKQKELEAERAKLVGQLVTETGRWNSKRHPTLSFDEASDLLPHALSTKHKANIERESEYDDSVGKRVNKNNFRVTLGFSVPLSKMPQKFRESWARCDVLNEELQKIEHQLNDLRRGRNSMKIQFLRDALKHSPEGQKVAAAIDSLAARVVDGNVSAVLR